MALPTITAIAPTKGPAIGENSVAIEGTNFRLYVPASSGYIGMPTPETVRVSFAGIVAPQVFVWSSTVLSVVPPAYAGDADLAFFAPVTITLQNVDDNGNPIPGETITRSEAYTYSREPLRMPTIGKETPFARITRGILRLLKRQIVLDSSFSTSTDYSPDGITIKKADVPSISLTNLRVSPDAYGYENGDYWETLLDGSAVCWPAPVMHTLTYDIVGSSDRAMEHLSLMAATRKFVRANPYFVMAADVPVGAEVRMPLAMISEPTASFADKNSNLNLLHGTIEVRRVPIVYLPPSVKTWPVDTVNLEVQKLQGILVETISMW